MFRHIRQAVLHLQRRSGMFRLVVNSQWRTNRLLILCYHGISRYDEHLWRPRLYMHPEVLRQRLEILKQGGYNVLPLGEGLRRLQTAELPPKSVVLTFDDGGYDFYAAAFPVIKDYGFPVTVYQTTYYSDRQIPVFNVVCSYLLWKGRDRVLHNPGELGLTGPLDLKTDGGRMQIVRKLVLDAEASNLTGLQKNDVAATLANSLEISYDEIVSSRIFQLMNSSELAELAAAEVDFQLHTHRHRTPLEEVLFRKEIQDNRRSLGHLGETAIHFCYPSGIHRPEFQRWLQMENVVSATTCDSGLASRRSNPFLLPRLVDTSARSAIEFEGWLTGLASVLTIRKAAPQIIPAAAGRASRNDAAQSVLVKKPGGND
jgi:peptidoglycan/xylan/chitin deacetylase (PgdA/CDA1 family)